jgi:hypothetical protein
MSEFIPPESFGGQSADVPPPAPDASVPDAEGECAVDQALQSTEPGVFDCTRPTCEAPGSTMSGGIAYRDDAGNVVRPDIGPQYCEQDKLGELPTAQLEDIIVDMQAREALGQGAGITLSRPEEAAPDITAPAGRRPIQDADILTEASAADGSVETAAASDAHETQEVQETFPDVRIVDVEPVSSPEEAMSAYEDFEDVFTADVRERMAEAALAAAREVVPDISEEDILVSGFETVPTEEGMAEADQRKLDVQSAVPPGGFADGLSEDNDWHRTYGGDDSNLWNVTERGIQELRDEKGAIGRSLADADARGELTDALRADGAERLAALNNQIAERQVDQASHDVPVYYATRLDGLRVDSAEDNPLAYVGDLPGTGHIALYDRRALVAAGVPISEKSPEQIRIATNGATLMRHCLAIVRFNIED